MSGPATTEDRHYVVIDGRRWCATDPAIPDGRRDELVHTLMAWRRDVRHAKGTPQESPARAGGSPPWWEQDAEQRRRRWQARVAEPNQV